MCRVEQHQGFNTHGKKHTCRASRADARHHISAAISISHAGEGSATKRRMSSAAALSALSATLHSSRARARCMRSFVQQCN